MSLWLGVDAATDVATVALGEPGGPVVAEATLGPRTHARDLMAAIDDLVRTQGRGWDHLEGIVVGDGPGSFTGLRIAWGTVLGILAGTGPREVRTAPSLLGAAAGCWEREQAAVVAAVYDAMRGDVFAAVYQFDDDRVLTRMAPAITTVAALVDARPAPQLVVTDGRVEDTAALDAWSGRDTRTPAEGVASSAALLGLVARGATTTVADPSAFVPTYGRKAEAQVRWEAEHGRGLPHA